MCLIRHTLKKMDTRSRRKARRLKARIFGHYDSLKAFAQTHGFNARTVKAAMRGERAGRVSSEIVRTIESLPAA